MKIILEDHEAQEMIHAAPLDKPLMLSVDYKFTDFTVNSTGRLELEARRVDAKSPAPAPRPDPSKITKLRVGAHLRGTVCGCGAPKKPHKWSCAACKAAIEHTPEGLALRTACAAHVTAAQAVIGLCRIRHVPIPTPR